MEEIGSVKGEREGGGGVDEEREKDREGEEDREEHRGEGTEVHLLTA